MVSVFLTGSWLIHIKIVKLFSPLTYLGITAWESALSHWKIPHTTRYTHFLQQKRMTTPLVVFCQALGLSLPGTNVTDCLPTSPPITVDTATGHLQRSFLLYVLWREEKNTNKKNHKRKLQSYQIDNTVKKKKSLWRFIEHKTAPGISFPLNQ